MANDSDGSIVPGLECFAISLEFIAIACQHASRDRAASIRLVLSVGFVSLQAEHVTAKGELTEATDMLARPAES